MKKNTSYSLAIKGQVMKTCTFLTVFLSLFSFNVNAQVFWTENFNNGCAAGCTAAAYVGVNGAWTVTSTGTEGSEPNNWYVSCAENGHTNGVCGTGCAPATATATLATLHIGADPVFIGDIGAAYDAGGLCGFIACPQTNRRVESPTINCTGKTTISVNFNFIEGGQTTIDDATLWYFNGTVWAQIDNMPKSTTASCGGQGLWASRTIALPASADNNANVKIGFRWVNNDDATGTDPSIAIDDLTLSTPVSGNTIATGTITGSPFCACSSVSVPFTSTGTFTAGNTYTAQLSNAAGSFAAPTAIGTLVSVANTGTITATIPCGTATGSAYRIRVISSAPATTGTDNGVNITITQPSVGTFSYTGTPYCQNASNPSPTFSGGGVSGTFTSTAGLVFVNAASGQVNLASSTSGTYTVTNTIAATGGCPAVTATSSITITPLAVGTFSYTGTPYCQNAANPSPTFSGGGIAGTFTSTAGLVFVSAATGQVNLVSSTPGTYTITNTIAATGGCAAVTATSTITITALAVATFSYTGTPYCQNASNPSPTFSGGGVAGTFTSTAGLVFVSASTGQINLASSTPGTYTVTNTIAATGGCAAVTATSSITITAIQSSAFSYSPSTFCSSGTNPVPAITGVSGGTFTSSPAGLNFVSASTGEINLGSSALNTYTITYTVAGSCGSSSTATVTITNAPAATFSYTGTPYCQAGTDPSPTFSGGGTAGTFSSTAGLSINVSTGQVSLSGSTAGTYTVTNTIAASGGCSAATATSTITITAVQSSAFSYASSTFCSSGTNPVPTITGASGGTFSSSPAGLNFVSASTGEINLGSSSLNTYTVTYTVAGSCGSSNTATVTITNAPAATFSYTGTPYCQTGTDPSPTYSGGGTAGTFSSAAGLNINASTGLVSLSGSTAGTYTVTNTIAASGGCPAATATATIVITSPQTGDFSYTGTPYCQTGTDPSPTFSGGGVAGTFTSTTGLSINASTGVVSLAGSTAGTYTVTNTIAASGGCPATTYTATITITVPPVATFSYTGTPYCQNAADPSPTFSGGGVAGTFNSSAGLVISATTGTVTLASSTPGTYTVTNTIAASGGCAAVTATSTITINASPTVIVTSATICSGQTATLTAAGATTYTWSAGATSTGTTTATASPTTTTSYTVTGSSSGCTATAVAVVVVNSCNVPVANFTANQTSFCNSGCANFTDLSTNTPTSWAWSFPGGTPSTSTSQNPTNICYSANGSYDVTLIATNANGSDTLTQAGFITIGNPVQVTISGNTVINACETTILYANPSDGTYSWGPNNDLSCGTCSAATVAPTTTQDYYVTYTSPSGCTDSDTITVSVQNLFNYYMPTGFSPNGDGINDMLQVHGRGIDYINLKIFDRIGEKVFSTTDPETGWDGKLLGLPMNDGVFVFALEVTFCNGDTVKEHGSIMLAR